MAQQKPRLTATRHRLYEQLALQGPIPRRFAWLPTPTATGPEALVRAVTDATTTGARLLERGEAGDATFHRFGWLSLAIGQPPETREACRSLLTLWMKRYATYTPPFWRASFTADRLFHLLVAATTLTEDQDAPWRERYLDLVARHVRHLRRAERQVSLEHEDAPSISLSHALGVMALPEDPSLGEVMTPRLQKIASRLADGVTPIGWRRHQRLLDDTQRLEMVIAGFIAKRLSTPAVLGSALSTARNILPLTIGPTGRTAHGPGLADAQHGAFQLSPENIARSRAHSPDLGRWRLDAGTTLLMVDAGQPQDSAGAGGISLYAGADPIIVNCGSPTPLAAGLVPGMGKWRDALSVAAAASTLDIPQNRFASVRMDTGAEGALIYLEKKVGSDLHRRRLLLRPDGQELLGEDLYRSAAGPGLFRFHLGPNTLCQVEAEGKTATLHTPDGELWQFVTNQATLSLEPSLSAWADGAIVDSTQLVLRATHEGVRWALRRRAS
ncbi:MAG: heparinase II/III domain-containing protein [Parvularcula sp.]